MELNLSQFITRLFAAAQAAGIAPRGSRLLAERFL